MSKPRKTADSITDDDLDDLYDNASRGWRRGDEWKKRALAAETAAERVQVACHGLPCKHVRTILAALDGPKESTTP
ncbi:hypothetical protein AB0912_00185 [Streptomyces sp. NPDC007084]|uniref:hypothetical protein n=1 Tax=Streptomyces sp. NPDC007084 TaxID=3154313 RepID=UPI003451DA9A